MGQIVKRKKVGRPPKSDLSRRELEEEAELDSRVRRSLRRRNVRYNFVDYDDFIDDDGDGYSGGNRGDQEEEGDDLEEEEEEEGDEERREKKVKLVVKLSHGGGASDEEVPEDEEDDDEEDGRRRRRRRRRKVVKRRRISSSGREDEDNEDEEEEEEEEEIEQLHCRADAEERRLRLKGDSKQLDSLPGTPPTRAAITVPLPDKKKLELILDKLQKKDTYGVYAEPVDPEELPDYHDVIEHPMDFSTVRKKLANGLYSTLEQLESDVSLICSNAMQYNAPDTIYHKQARTIQELGQKKFQKLRNDYERSEREQKSEHKGKSDFDSSEKENKVEQRMKSSPLIKKHMKKPPSRPFPEPVGSDFSAGATLAGEPQNVSAADQAGDHEMPIITTDGVLESSPFRVENSLEKGEELSTGKGSSAKFWRKPSTVDENRRATYNISTQPILRVESIFTTFDSEIKQLVAVGLDAENSYARSLARFAAALGPIAWKVASQRIEEVLPSGSKYGRGWVGEYEPLPTPILMPEKSSVKDYFLMTNSHRNVDSRKDFKVPAPPRDNPASNFASEARPGPFYKKNGSPAVNSSGLKVNVAATANHQQPQSPLSRNRSGSSRKVVKQFELNSLPPTSQCNADYLAEKKPADNSDVRALRQGQTALKNLNDPHREVSVPEVLASRSKEMVANNVSSPQSVPFKQLERSGVAGRGLSNGKIVSNGFANTKVDSPSNGLPSEVQVQVQQPPAFFLRQDQGLSDPVQLMRMLAEKAQTEQNPQKLSSNNTPAVAPPVPSVRKDTSGNAATAAASVWMSIGGGGFRQATENSSSPRNQTPTPTTDSPYSSPRDPVQSMRMLSEKAQRQQNPHKHSADGTPAVAPPVPSIRRDTSGNAATAAASAWMSIGGGGGGGGGGGFKQATENSFSPRNHIPTSTDAPYSSHGEIHPSQMARIQGQFPASSGATYLQRERGGTLPPPFMQQQIPVGLNNEAQFSNRPAVFPQLMMANLARFQAQTTWRGISPHTQQRTKQDTLPPDLNIGFQAPGSPVMQSSGVKMEQQPDLALQL